MIQKYTFNPAVGVNERSGDRIFIHAYCCLGLKHIYISGQAVTTLQGTFLE